MLIKETKTKVITLDESDLKQTILMYLKARAEPDINPDEIVLQPATAGAVITLTETIEPQ
jgi:hypothetical protein